jgi:hypothetical protein
MNFVRNRSLLGAQTGSLSRIFISSQQASLGTRIRIRFGQLPIPIRVTIIVYQNRLRFNLILTSSLNHNFVKLRLCLNSSKARIGSGLVKPSAT